MHGGNHNYDKVAKELGCSREIAICITDYWDIMPVYKDRERTTPDIEYFLKRTRYSIRQTELLYALYTNCSKNEAEQAVQTHLDREFKELDSMYPGGKREYVEGEKVIAFDLKDEQDDWLALRHPFFEAHSKDPQHSLEVFYHALEIDIFRSLLGHAYCYSDGHIEYYGYDTKGTEASNKLWMWQHNQFWHDVSPDTATLWVPDEEELATVHIPLELMTKDYYKGMSLPPSEGYWEQDGKIYVKKPYDLDGIFRYERKS